MRMKRISMIVVALVFLLSAGKAIGSQSAPEISGDRWINSDPQTLEALRGKVLLVDFWTFG